MAKRLVCTFFLFFAVYTTAQITVTGIVIDATTREPIEGVSVFYDGTTIGSITNQQGAFTLTAKAILNTPLIISYIGFEPQLFSVQSNLQLGVIELIEKPVQLDEVVLVPDTWSREKKLRYFRREFLGSTEAASKCTIENENDIWLYYNKEKGILYAQTSKPIRITNTYLGYSLSYEMTSFETRIETSARGYEWATSTYNAGIVRFSELNLKKPKKKILNNREKLYYGSSLHFLRALSIQKVDEEGFRVFVKGFQVYPYNPFIVQKLDNGLTQIEQKEPKVSLLFGNGLQSQMEIVNNPFFIDTFGNHYPPDAVLFGGHFGEARIGGMLPLDYEPE